METLTTLKIFSNNPEHLLTTDIDQGSCEKKIQNHSLSYLLPFSKEPILSTLKTNLESHLI